jgi:hypothetical protein
MRRRCSPSTASTQTFCQAARWTPTRSGCWPQAQAFVKADDAQLKAAGTHALPTIKRHLAMAQQLAGAMKGSPWVQFRCGQPIRIPLCTSLFPTTSRSSTARIWQCALRRASTASRLSAAITAEALEDHFGAHSALESALMAAFDSGRNPIRSVCAEAIDQNGGKGVVLHSGLFRVDGTEPDRGTTA